MNLMAPGDYIVPVQPEKIPFGVAFIESRPYLCTSIFPTHAVCVVCGPSELGLTVAEFPDLHFCAAHWRPVYRKKSTLTIEDFQDTQVPA